VRVHRKGKVSVLLLIFTVKYFTELLNTFDKLDFNAARETKVLNNLSFITKFLLNMEVVGLGLNNTSFANIKERRSHYEEFFERRYFAYGIHSIHSFWTAG